MILVRRDPAFIPDKLLKVAARAQAKLEALPAGQRPDFVKKKAHIWRKFGTYLSQMSYGKCWYSESPDPHSFFDVDHFRPKLAAKRLAAVTEPGYEWLAFSWENFRYSAGCANRLSQDHEAGIVIGKGSWFPLLENSPKADWGNRCEANERPVLLDPVIQADVDLIEVKADGDIGPSRFAVGSALKRVEFSRQCYGLGSQRLIAARKRVMRDIDQALSNLAKTRETAINPQMPVQLADQLPIPDQITQIREKTSKRSPYSLAARAALYLAGYPELCASD